MNMYKSAIVDELGYVVAWYDQFESEEDVRAFLNDHSGYRLTCVEV